ncbi:MAG: ribose-phosphate diphosphokinase, partial [Patescibacteria group bacterium]
YNIIQGDDRLVLEIFYGRSYPDLTERICSRLKIKASTLTIKSYKNGCVELALDGQKNRKNSIVIVQTSDALNLSDDIWELLLMVRTAKELGYQKIIVVMPYLSYARSDKPSLPGMIITGKFLMELLNFAGANYFIGIDLHSKKFESTFPTKMKLIHLSALEVLAKQLENENVKNVLLLPADEGALEKANRFGKLLNIDDIGNVVKKRINDNKVKLKITKCNPKDKHIIVIDDEISTGTTMGTLIKKLTRLGAKSVTIVATHGLFVGNAIENLKQSILKKIIVTDTIPITEETLRLLPIEVVAVDELLANAICELI